MRNEWFPYRKGRPDAALRLFCFAYAGGGATLYRSWEAHLPPFIELCAIQLPGREGRFLDPACRSMAVLLDALEPHLLGLIDRSYALFGYSAGAVMAHAVALRLHERTGRMPLHLFAAACAPPQLHGTPALHSCMDDAQFQRHILELNGHAATLTANPELLSLSLPVIRADLQVIESYQPPSRWSLTCPVCVFGGSDDPQNPPGALMSWAATTSGPFELHTYPGGHFFIHEHLTAIARRVSGILEPHRHKRDNGCRAYS